MNKLDCSNIKKMTEQRAYKDYDRMLDDCYPGQICNIRASKALKAVDLVMYMEGFYNYCDSRGIEIID